MLNIGLLEDDEMQAQHIALKLAEVGHECVSFTNSKDFIASLESNKYDLLVLDWVLPDIPGDQVLKWIREHLGWQIPVIFVTSRDNEADIVYALQQGADDYLTKPIKPMELVARLNALARRSHLDAPEKTNILTVGPFKLDGHRSCIIKDDKEIIDLTQKEYDLVEFLFQHIGQLLSRQKILENVWGHRAELNTRTVDTHVSRIRNKLGLFPDQGWRLTAIYQHGYRLERLEELDIVKK